jgi:hypothetical protein
MNFTEPTIESADSVVFTLPGRQAALFRVGASVSIAVVVVMLVVLYAWKANRDLRKVKPLTTKPEYDFLIGPASLTRRRVTKSASRHQLATSSSIGKLAGPSQLSYATRKVSAQRTSSVPCWMTFDR